MLIWKLALRNLLRQRHRTLFTGLSMFVGFVMAGFFIGWADGTYNHMIDTFTRSRLGHIQIHQEGYLDRPSLYKTIGDPEDLGVLLSEHHAIEAWTPRIHAGGLVSIGSRSTGAQLIGIDIEREDAATSFSNKIIDGRYLTRVQAPDQQGDRTIPQGKEAILGMQLAEILKGTIGDEIALFSQAADGSIAEELFTVVGLADLGDPGLNRSTFIISLEDAQESLVLWDQVHEIAVVLRDMRTARETTSQIQQILDREYPGNTLSTASWQEFAADFYRAMQADKNGMYLSLVVVVIIAAITVLNTVLMSVMERQREYGVLKAIGTRPNDIVKMIMAETSLLALLSIILGTAATFLLNSYMAQRGIELREPIDWGGMQLTYMRGEVNLRSFLIPSITVIVTALVVSIIPALKAARTEPAKTMRSI
jgi:putative ABC transport system permease protein